MPAEPVDWRASIGSRHAAVNLGCSPARRSEQPGTRGLEVFRRVDPGRRLVDGGDRDVHAGFKGAQLLQPFGLFQRRGRQCHEPF